MIHYSNFVCRFLLFCIRKDGNLMELIEFYSQWIIPMY